MRGGVRKGAGRPPVPTGKAMKIRSIRLHDEEYESVKKYINFLKHANNCPLHSWYIWDNEILKCNNCKLELNIEPSK